MAQRSQLPSLFAGSPFPWSGADPFSMLQREMGRLLGEAARGGGALVQTAETPAIMAPRIDISESESDIKVRAELPGVDPQDVEVTATEDLLTIRGEKRVVRDEGQEHFHLVERAYGAFVRNIRLPFKVDPGQVQANFENGVLTIALPKPTELQPRTSRIEVKGAGQPGASEQTLKSAADEMRTANAPQEEPASKAGAGTR
ncbi:Hsp20 family protein [Azospirillum melinis]|uniref:Hsp20 family protein n=1 Tax=Azospirillum melinis TaxID=328839 RepID=A0ABX2K2A6_9PROT|nr:Hsp20/alpha crystallin family protein [Azospirillum melinis]MBP2305225.1 HSP20 family protein [Azospirillum melinis]NUA97692.1 Hsp20 family protein [Azospirillum melinis]